MTNNWLAEMFSDMPDGSVVNIVTQAKNTCKVSLEKGGAVATTMFSPGRDDRVFDDLAAHLEKYNSKHEQRSVSGRRGGVSARRQSTVDVYSITGKEYDGFLDVLFKHVHDLSFEFNFR